MENLKALSQKELIEIEGGDPTIAFGELAARIHHAGFVGIVLGVTAYGSFQIGSTIYENNAVGIQNLLDSLFR